MGGRNGTIGVELSSIEPICSKSLRAKRQSKRLEEQITILF